MSDLITIVCYRPSGVDTCRGCIVDSWGSEFEIREFDHVETAAAFIAIRRRDDLYKAVPRSSNWDITTLVNGKTNDLCGSEVELTEAEEALISLLVRRVADHLVVLKQEHEAALAEAARKKAEAAERASTAERDRRRALFMLLKQEFD